MIHYMIISWTFQLLCFAAAIGFPFYQTVLMFEEKKFSDEWVQWLTYWCLYAVSCFLEYYLNFITLVPFYFEIKFIVILWLILPWFEGATFLHYTFIDRIFTIIEDYFIVFVKPILSRIPLLGSKEKDREEKKEQRYEEDRAHNEGEEED